VNTVSPIAKKFCDYHNSTLSKGQIQMIEDGLPAALAMSQEQRRAARNLDAALTTMPKETVPPLYPPETEAMKQATSRLKKLSSKRAIHVPKKAKKSAPAKKTAKLNPNLPSTHPGNRGAGTKVAKTKNRAATAAKAKASEQMTEANKARTVAPKPTSAVRPAAGRVSGQAIGEATCRKGGITMAELVAEFGIEAHPMRAKIHYAKHKLGFTIVSEGGRYVGTAPKVTA